MRPLSLCLSLALLLSMAGCPSAPVAETPLPSPRVHTLVRHAAGSPLGGGVATADAGTADRALQVTVSFYALELLPETLLDSLASQVRLTVDPAEDRPLLAAGTLAAHGRAGPVPDVPAFLEALARQGGRVTRFAELRGALPRGVTAAFEALRDCEGRDACEPLHERFSVLVYRDEQGQVEHSIEIEDTHPACAVEPRARPDRELSILSRAVASLPAEGPGADAGSGNGAFAVIVRSPFHGDDARALAALVAIAPPPDLANAAAHEDAFEACAADLAREAFLHSRRSAPRSAAEGREPGPASDVVDPAGLGERAKRRATLLALARRGDAPMAEEVALAAADDLVAKAARAVATTDLSGWAIERAALCAIRSELGAGDPSASLAEILGRRGGAAGRSADAFFALADRASSLEELDRLLVAENEALLEDASPAMRVRASEWLARRGRAPRGYDPLAPAAERRAALEARGAQGQDER